MNRRCVIVATAAATVIKLFLAWFTVGTNDVVTWQAFAATAQACGACVYGAAGPHGDPFNHPPFIIHFLKILPTYSFPFFLRLPGVIADIGTIIIASRIFNSITTGRLVILALNPVSILISGFHGNTDSVMVFFLLLAMYLVKINRLEWGGAVFAMSVSIKVVPLLFVPCFLLYMRDVTARLRFCLVGAATVFLLSVPYILQTTAILPNVLGYRGLFTNWGVAHYADLMGFKLHALSNTLRYLIICLGFALPVFLRKREYSMGLSCTVVFLAFFVLTPSMALQYFVWFVPFGIVLGIARAALYYCLAALLIAYQYHRWSGGKWYFADSHLVLPVTAETELISLALWIVLCSMLYVIIKTNRFKLDEATCMTTLS